MSVVTTFMIQPYQWVASVNRPSLIRIRMSTEFLSLSLSTESSVVAPESIVFFLLSVFKICSLDRQ